MLLKSRSVTDSPFVVFIPQFHLKIVAKIILVPLFLLIN